MSTGACSPPQDESPAFGLIVLAIIGAETIVGAWINAFIVTVCCIDRLKNKSLGAVDRILLVLATNRFCFLITGMLRLLCKTLSPKIYYSDFFYRGLKATLWFFISSNLWLAACLCLFYCLKIANFSHSLFVSLKLKISRAVPALLLSSALLSFVNTTPFFGMIYTFQCNIPNATASGNVTTYQIDMHTNWGMLLFLCGFGFSVVFVIFVVSAILLLVSLWQHAWQLRDVLSSYTSPRMAAHVQAVKLITSFLITYLVNFVALMVLLTNTFSEDSPLVFFCSVVLNACPTAHSVVLILTNPRFKKAFLQMLQYGRCKW
ncbi:taste receptor type 2 member 40-like [Heteronotia binoei]|uniref:taste receptor type 2 member 40-like n=1 Tax=Heteronotia binoei TaxID=13085 RepID=UPI00292F98CA|nr:taste receptor type 2 member 40-like [Heteronotia binoei]